jgi:hypothetical protein
MNPAPAGNVVRPSRPMSRRNGSAAHRAAWARVVPRVRLTIAIGPSGGELTRILPSLLRCSSARHRGQWRPSPGGGVLTIRCRAIGRMTGPFLRVGVPPVPHLLR